MESSVLLAFPLLLALSTPCSACRCKLEHPQSYYCTSDIVMLVDILGPGENTVLKRSFKVRVSKIFRAPKGITQIDHIYTPKYRKDCGYELTDEKSQLLIAGYWRAGRVNFTRCHLVSLWQSLTREQKLGFEALYRTGCQCEVQRCYCWLGCPEPELTQCVWKQHKCDYDTWTGNLSLYSMCVPSSSGPCAWASTQLYHTGAPSTVSMTTIATATTNLFLDLTTVNSTK